MSWLNIKDFYLANLKVLKYVAIVLAISFMSLPVSAAFVYKVLVSKAEKKLYLMGTLKNPFFSNTTNANTIS